MNTGLIKKRRIETGFVQIPNAIAQSPELTAKEKGIMLCLLSLPDDWKIYKTQLHKFFHDGRDSIIGGFDSLMARGYITAERVFDPTNGHFIGYNYFVSPIPEKPETVTPIPENPKSDNPKTENPKSDKPSLQRHSSTNKKNTNKNLTNDDFDLTGLELPFNETEFVNAWESWIIHRNQMRKKLSRLAGAAQLKKLSMECSNGITAADWIIHAIASGWQGIYPPKNQTNNVQHSKISNDGGSFARRVEKYRQLDQNP